MKKRFILLATLLLTGFLPVTKTSAQTTTATANQYTLQQCLDYALKNYNDIKNAELDIQSAKAKVGEIRGAGLPTITGAASIVDNPRIQRMFLRGENAAAFDTSHVYQPGQVYALPNLFQLRASGDANIGINQLLFDGSYLMGLKASKVYRDLANKSMVQTKIQVVENVTKAFYMVLINREQLQLLDANVGRLDSLFNNTQALQKEGYTESIDVNRIEVSRNNLLVERTKFQQLSGVSELLLKYQMGMPLDDSLAIAGSIRDIQVDAVDTKAEANAENRIEFKVLRAQSDLRLLDVKSYRAKFFPTLSAFAKGGYMRMDQSVSNLFKNEWFSYSSIGLNLSVPIMEGGSRLYRLKQANYEYQKSENNLDQFRKSADFQVRQSRISLENEMQTLTIHERNLKLATEVVRVSKIKYTNGSGSNLEVTDAENSFKEAQTNYFNAVYNVLLSKIEYQKSTGTLYTE